MQKNIFRERYHGDALDKISNRKGGSLIEVDKAAALNEPAFIISLGGLGGMTLNELKKKYLEGVSRETRKNIVFLAVDTCTAALDDIRINPSTGEMNPSGYIEDDEFCNIITNVPAIAHLPALMHEESYSSPCKKWYDMNMSKSPITDDGAGGVRQIGRLMLSDAENWRHLFRKIVDKMTGVINVFPIAPTKLHVILIAGISGGTGSGTIVDISYMVRLAAKRFLNATLTFESILFTPDVQFHTGANNQLLKRNFGAAMKEINTFMFADRTQDKYRFYCSTFPNGIIKDELDNSIDAPENIFDSCTLVQGYDTDGKTFTDLKIPMRTVANYVINLLTDTNITSDGVIEQVLTSVLSNDISLTPDATTNYISRNRERPVDVYYKYRTIGFSSVTFPIEAIMTLLANKTVEALYKMYDKNRPSQTAREVLSQGSIAIAPKTIGRDSFSELNDDHLKHAYDLILKTYIRGNSCPTLTKSQIQHQQSLRELTQQASPGDFSITNATHKTEDEAIEYIITQIKTYVNREMENHNGPYATLRLSQDICKIMRDMSDTRGKYYAKTAAYLEEQKNRLKNALSALCDSYRGAILHPNSREVQEFNEYYEQYIRTLTFEKHLSKAMNTIAEVYNKYVELHNSIFEIYTGAFDAIMQILKGDSTAIADAVWVVADGTTTFSANLFNPKDLNNVVSNLSAIVTHYLNDPKRVNALADRLIDDILNNENAWTATDNSFRGVDRIRDLFKAEFETFVSDQIEKFAVVKYADEAKALGCMDNVIDELDKIGQNNPDTGVPYTWTDFENWYINTFTPANNKTPLDIAAEEIFNKATSVGLLARVEDNGKPPSPFETDLKSSFNCYQLLCLMKSTPNINSKIMALPAFTALTSPLNFRVGVGNTSQVYTIYVTCGVPLYILKGMKEVQKTYVDRLNDSHNNPGMHMDASEEIGWRYFPEIVPNSALYYLDRSEGKTEHKSGADYRYEKDIEDNIYRNVEKLDNYGMIEYENHPSPHFAMNVPMKEVNSIELIDNAFTRFEAVYEANLNNVNPTGAVEPLDYLAEQFKDISSQYTLKKVLDFGTIIDLRGITVNYSYNKRSLKLDTDSMPHLTDGVEANMTKPAKLSSVARAVRVSADWRNEANRAVAEYTPLYNRLNDLKKEIEERIKEKKMIAVSANVHNQMLKVFVKAILVGMIKIIPECMNGMIISLKAVAATSDNDPNFKIFTNTKGNVAFTKDYEKEYYLYGSFSRFLFSIDTNYTSTWWNTFKHAVDAKFNSYASDVEKLKEMMKVAKENFIPDLSPLCGLATWEIDSAKVIFDNKLEKSDVFPDYGNVVINGNDTSTAIQINEFNKQCEGILAGIFGQGWRTAE